MGRTHEERLFRYVKDGRLKRVRSLLKKHKIDLNFQDGKKRTALHIACILGEYAIVDVLLQHGASKEAKDMDGNTPLHLALNYALQVLEKRVYDDLILPLLHPNIEQDANDQGETPRDLIKRFRKELKRKREDRKIFEEEEELKREKARERKEWDEKLFFELGNDDEDFTSFTENDDKDLTRETYDEWVDRIGREKYRKEYLRSKQKQKTCKEKTRIQRENEERTRILEEEHRKYLKDVCEKRKQLRLKELQSDYESRCDAVFSPNITTKLAFNDIPWPCKGTVEEMTELLSKWICNDEDGKKYLKEQQIRWHPDRFFQKCGDRLIGDEKETILSYVKQLSQGINILLDG